MNTATFRSTKAPNSVGTPVRAATKMALFVAVIALISACSSSRTAGGYYRGDAPPKGDFDASTVIDAVPTEEGLCPSCNDPYTVLGKRYIPYDAHTPYSERGTASWYGKKFHGRKTASGETYDMYRASAAHKTLPLPSYARVTNLDNGESIIVKVNDRGPFHSDRIIDLSYGAAQKIGLFAHGTGQVEVTALNPSAPRLDPIVESTINLPSPLSPQTTTQAEIERLTPIFFQVGVFTRGANAEQMLVKLARQGIEPVSIEQEQGKLGGIYKVRVGPLSDAKRIQLTRERFSQLGIQARQTIVE